VGLGERKETVLPSLNVFEEMGTEKPSLTVEYTRIFIGKRLFVPIFMKYW
jgi:hypothetical protein